MDTLDSYKQQAAERALDDVQAGMLLGLGSGSTARYLVLGLAERLRDGRLRDVVGVPTSDVIRALAQQHDVPLTTLDEHLALDLAIDGADEIDPQINLIKGRGGALLREKIVASAAQRFVVIADDSKLVQQLGLRVALPVEVVPFGQALTAQRLRELGAVPALRHAVDGSPFKTDHGNLILDCRFVSMPDPLTLGAAIRAIPGVVEHGLFVGMAAAAYVAGPAGLTVIAQPNVSG